MGTVPIFVYLWKMGTVPIYLLARFQPRLSFPLGQETMPASGFQTVFSITHSDHWLPRIEFRAIMEIGMLSALIISCLVHKHRVISTILIRNIK